MLGLFIARRDAKFRRIRSESLCEIFLRNITISAVKYKRGFTARKRTQRVDCTILIGHLEVTSAKRKSTALALRYVYISHISGFASIRGTSNMLYLSRVCFLYIAILYRRYNSRDLIIGRLGTSVGGFTSAKHRHPARGDFHFVLITRSAALYFGRPVFHGNR